MLEGRLNPPERYKAHIICRYCRDWFLGYSGTDYCPECAEEVEEFYNLREDTEEENDNV